MDLIANLAGIDLKEAMDLDSFLLQESSEFLADWPCTTNRNTHLLYFGNPSEVVCFRFLELR